MSNEVEHPAARLPVLRKSDLVDRQDVRQALGIAEDATVGSASCSTDGKRLGLSLTLGFAVLLAGLLLVRRGGLPMAGGTPIAGALVVGLIVAGVAVFLVRSGRR